MSPVDAIAVTLGALYCGLIVAMFFMAQNASEDASKALAACLKEN